MSRYPVKRTMEEFFAYLLTFGTMVAYNMLALELAKAEQNERITDEGRIRATATLIGFASFDIK